MSRFARHREIEGWQQEALAEASVVVNGRGWAGVSATLALASMGCGEIRWIGVPNLAPAAEPLCQWLLEGFAFPDTAFIEFPTDLHTEGELALAGFGDVSVFLETTGGECAQALTAAVTPRLRRPAFYAGAAGGGWFGSSPPPTGVFDRPAWFPAQMVMGALLADAARESVFPLNPGLPPASGAIHLAPVPLIRRPGHVLVVGAGAIGIYVSLGLAALGFRQTIVDFDTIEESNLSRQGIYAHRIGESKATVAHEFLLNHFPDTACRGLREKITEESRPWIQKLGPDLIVSAVDNAPARLALQHIARQCGVPLIQGGTDTFCADCYTQEIDGALLDEQLHGALSEAATTARTGNPRRAGGCLGDPIYVVPGMVAAGCILHRICQLTELYRGLPPLNWSIGSLPVEKSRVSNPEFEYV